MTLGMAAGQRIAEVATDSTKGSFGNRMDCAGEHLKNDATTYLKQAGVLGTVAAGTALAGKNPGFFKPQGPLSKISNKVVHFVANHLPKSFNTKIVDDSHKLWSSFNESLKYMAANPKTALGATLVAEATVIAMNAVSKKGAYKSGQIDQKYADRAAVQKQIV
ncbi:MAG: hypothetical protein ACI4S3_04505, partial [Candidatus Gastranaerophilaceae bacterium]